MGKKVISQSSLTTTKNYDKKQLNSLMKVLRPKVYITDSSSFKRLVQELTGNAIPIAISSSSPPPSSLPAVDQIQVIDIEDHDYNPELTRSVELPLDSSESVPTPFTAPESSPELSMPSPFNAYDCSIMTNQMDISHYYRDIESSSWLLEFEPFPYYDLCAPPLIQ